MKRLNYISFAAKIFGCLIVGLTTIVSACKSTVEVHCQPEGFDSPIVWNFEIINDGQELGFNYSDSSEEGSIGTDWLQLKAK